MGWGQAGLTVLVSAVTTVVTRTLQEWREDRAYYQALKAVEQQTELITKLLGAKDT